MKIFFDTNVYIAEALLGRAAERMLEATLKGSWRIYTSEYVGEELQRVLTEALGFPRRFAILSRKRILRRATAVEPGLSRHVVPDDPHDSPILQAALAASADYLVTNDAHLLDLSPYEGLQILSMTDYYQLLVDHGLLPGEALWVAGLSGGETRFGGGVPGMCFSSELQEGSPSRTSNSVTC